CSARIQRFFFFQAEDGIRDFHVTGVQTCALPILDKQWRHLDFFQFEAWLHAKVPRVKCTSCGKTTQVEVPWARPGSGFTLLFERSEERRVGKECSSRGWRFHE